VKALSDIPALKIVKKFAHLDDDGETVECWVEAKSTLVPTDSMYNTTIRFVSADIYNAVEPGDFLSLNVYLHRDKL
jgi:hypothetical protein